MEGKRVKIFDYAMGEHNRYKHPLEKIEVGEGVFQSFSTDHEEFETGPGLYPVAIVIENDGTVITPHANMIQFIDN